MNCNPNCPCGNQPGTCVFYTGAETAHLHILTNTNLNDVVRILDEAVEGIVPVETALTRTITLNSTTGIALTGANTQTIGSNPTYTIGIVPTDIRALFTANFPLSYNNATGVFSSSLTQYTNEMAQDTVAAMIGAGTHIGISFSYVDSANTLSAIVSQVYIRTSISMDNGLTYNNITGLGQLGGDLVKNTTIDTDAYILTVTGNRIYNYGFSVETRHEWPVGGPQAWKAVGKLTTDGVPNPINLVRLGINYTEELYFTAGENQASGGPFTEIPGIFGNTVRGYILGANMLVHGSFGVDADDITSKMTGLVFHTKEGIRTEGVSIFAVPTSAYGGVGIALGEGANYRVACFHTDKSVQHYGYPNTRNDGSSSKHLYTDVNGFLKLGDVAIRTFTPTSTADSAGTTGDITYDSSFVYVKTSAGWKRSALSTF